MLSPLEQKTTMGERMLRRSMAVPSGVEIDVTSPVALKTQIARRLGVDLGIDIILLGPQRVCGVLVLEILHQPGAVEFAAAQVAGKRGKPAPAEQSAAVAHGIFFRARRPNR